jgi:hypothetical protein
VLLPVLVLTLLGVWFLPVMLARTILCDRISQQASAELNGKVEVAGAFLSWFSPIELRDITVLDAENHVIVRVPRLTISKSLLSLVLDSTRPGEVVIEHPVVDLVCTNGVSNLERLVRTDNASPPSTRAEVTIRIEGGTLNIRDANSPSGNTAKNLNATIVVPIAMSEPVTARITADAPSAVEAELSIGDEGHAKVIAGGLAMELVSPLLARFQPGLRLGGTLQGDISAKWGANAASVGTLELGGTLNGKDFVLEGPWFNGDSVKLATVDLPLKLSVVGRAVTVERAVLTSDLGSVSVLGVLDTDESFEAITNRPGLKLAVSLDLARCAAAMPKLMRIRDGVEVREGKVDAVLESKITGTGVAWSGEISSTSLKARRGGQDLHWEEPLEIEFAGQVEKGRWPTLERLTCRSDFIAINAKVSHDSVRMAANVYLDRLAERLAEFIDLGGARLDGRGSASLVIQRDAQGIFQAHGKGEFQQFVYLDHAEKGLHEPSVHLEVSANGKAADQGPISLSSATVKLAFTAGDELRLETLAPIENASGFVAGTYGLRLDGDLARWRKRASAFVSLPAAYALGGQAQARGNLRLDQKTIAIDQLRLTIDRARFHGAGLDLDEPRIEGSADLVIDRQSRTATFDHFTIVSAPLNVSQGRMVIARTAAGEVTVEGSGPAATDLNRLGKTVKLYTDPRGPDSLHGRGTGPIHFRNSGDTTTFGGELALVNIAVGLPSAPAAKEATLKLALEGSYSDASDTLSFTSARIERPGLELAAAGTLSRLDTSLDADLSGTLTYDYAVLTRSFGDVIDEGFEATGRGSKTFRISGSLGSSTGKQPPEKMRGLNGEVALGWDRLKSHGFDVGAGELHGLLRDGVCRFDTINASFGGGRVSLQPTLRFDLVPSYLTLEKGLVVDHAKLTPAVCARALGYALPAIARSGRAEGEISLTLGDNQVPLGDYHKTTAVGQIVIHKATVAPGPVVGEVAGLLGANNTTMTLANETPVPVRIENGRVHHQNFPLKLGGTTVVTSGSVGFDGSLDMSVDVPVPGNLPGVPDAAMILKQLAGKTIQVPLRGTLAHPAIDSRHFQLELLRLTREAAKGLGRDLFHKELDKFLPGMPVPRP